LVSFHESDPIHVIEKVEARLRDSSFPESKKWIYLCGLPEFAVDQQRARAVIESFARTDPTDFNRSACTALLDLFWQHSAQAGNPVSGDA
jgi:hypothetical protein